MKKLSVLTVLFFLISLAAFAANPPAKTVLAFKQMYPDVVNMEWDKKSSYYIADFVKNGYETDVWFNRKSQWVMTETDVESLEAIPAAVSEAFMKSTFSAMRLEDVRVITFPKQPTVIVIEVEGYNSNEEYQLFYAPDGRVLQTLNVSNTGGEIYPKLF